MSAFMLHVVLRSVLAIAVGIIIGSERAKHGRAAGSRTYMLVSLGACMTAMTSVYVNIYVGSGDIFRISAQVVCGIGFLGAGIIIFKDNNVITGLTTAAGVWTTATIGIAFGYGFYYGTVIVTVLYLVAIIFFSKIEKTHKTQQIIYIEVDDLYKINNVIKSLKNTISEKFTYCINSPKSGKVGNIGLCLNMSKRLDINIDTLCSIKNIAYAVEE